jgi:glycosyltransferase involved in cell wall biosynthesis
MDNEISLQPSEEAPVLTVSHFNESFSRGPEKRQIRILHSVGHLRRGGIEMWLYQAIKALDPEQFDHHVLVRTDKEESFTEDFRKAGIKVLQCLNYQNPIRYARNLTNIIRENGPYEILHVHGSNPNGLMALMLARRLGIRTSIVHSHNDVRPLLQQSGSFYRAYVRLTLSCLRRFCDYGIAASALAAESMFGPSWQKNQRHMLLAYGIDFRPFTEPRDPDLRRQLGIPSGAFVVGHVGRFEEQKNHELLVEIAEEAVKQNPTLHFLFIGEGSLRSRITSDIEHRHLTGHVTFVSDTLAVPRFMRSAMDCFVFPSRYEGLGLVAVEAQAAGLPCLVSDRVPKEATVDRSLVKVLRLDEGAKAWADAILQSIGRTRTLNTSKHLEQFERSDFDLNRSILALAAIYRSIGTTYRE